jgi:hypothetical protein
MSESVLQLAKAPFPRPVAEIDRQKTWRFSALDLDRMAVWLMPKLREAYPHHSDTQIVNFLRSCMVSNDWLFACTENAVLLAQIVTPPMRLMRVDEEFCCTKEEDTLDEAADLYRDLKRWADRIGASKILVDQFSDVPRNMIQYRVGKVEVQRVVVHMMGEG